MRKLIFRNSYKKKNSKNLFYSFFFSAIFISSFLFLCCNNSLSYEDDFSLKTESKSQASVTSFLLENFNSEDFVPLKVCVNGSSLRTALPQVDFSDFTVFKLFGTFVSDSTTEEAELYNFERNSTDSAYEVMTDSVIFLPKGTWNLRLAGYEKAGALYSGTAENVVVEKSSASKTVSFELSLQLLSTSGIGSLEVKINFPQNENISKIKTALYKYSDYEAGNLSGEKIVTGSEKVQTLAESSESYTYSMPSLAAGLYAFCAQFYGTDSNTSEDFVIGSTFFEFCGITAEQQSFSQINILSFDSVRSITYNLDGGTLEGDFRGSYSAREHGVFLLPKVDSEVQQIKKEDSVFAGWYESSDFSGSPITALYTSRNEDVTFYARWLDCTQYVTQSGTAFPDDFESGFTEDTAFRSVNDAVSHINNLCTDFGAAENSKWKIKVSGGVTGYSSVAGIKASELELSGKTSSSIDSLSGDSTGRVLLINNEIPVSVKNLTVQNGIGGIFVDGFGITSTNVTIENCKIVQNNAGSGENGGGICANAAGTLKIKNTEISENSANLGGGIFVADGCTLSLENVTLSKNNADNGGGIYNGGKCFVYGTTVVGNGNLSGSAAQSSASESESSNAANQNGGGVYNEKELYLGYKDSDSLSDLTGGIYYNYAQKGGGVYNAASSSLKIASGVIGNNGVTSESGGGAVFSRGSISMTGGTMSYNNADMGGAVYVGGSATFTMDGGLICNNTSSIEIGSGGGVLVAGSFVMNDGEISGNSGRMGGGICVFKKDYTGSDTITVTMTGGEVSGNQAQSLGSEYGLGGGVYIQAESKFAMSGGVIKENTADAEGGAVYMGFDATNIANMKFSTFELSGSSYLPGGDDNSNDIFVSSILTLTGNLSSTETPVALIRPMTYMENFLAITGMSVVTNYNKFAVKPNPDTGENWRINFYGMLEKN